MSQKVEKFLEFNGKKILFLGKDGMYWIAIKPICEALGIEYTRTFKNIKEDPILSQPLAVQPIVAADGKMREMSCLPEFYVYGWLMGIQSEAQGLKEYKWECYRVLYEHFHGAITGRKELIKQKAQIQLKIDSLKNKVFASTEAQELDRLGKRQKAIERSLMAMDNQEFEEELELCKENVENTEIETSL